MWYYIKNWETIVLKHSLLVILAVIKFLFLAFIIIVVTFFWVFYREIIWDELFLYVLFPFCFILLNYAFLRLVLALIEYYNYMFIIKDDQIIIINSSFILRDDIEIIESYKIIKMDSYSRWFFSNILWFWNIIVELQTKEERIFRFMPNPFRLINKLKAQRDYVLENRRKKYIVDDFDDIKIEEQTNDE